MEEKETQKQNERNTGIESITESKRERKRDTLIKTRQSSLFYRQEGEMVILKRITALLSFP